MEVLLFCLLYLGKKSWLQEPFALLFDFLLQRFQVSGLLLSFQLSQAFLEDGRLGTDFFLQALSHTLCKFLAILVTLLGNQRTYLALVFVPLVAYSLSPGSEFLLRQWGA